MSDASGMADCRYCGVTVRSLRQVCEFAQANKALARHEARCSTEILEARSYYLKYRRWRQSVAQKALRNTTDRKRRKRVAL